MGRWEMDDRAEMWTAAWYEKGRGGGREGGIEQRGGISRTEGGRQAPVSLHSFNSTKQPAYY